MANYAIDIDATIGVLTCRVSGFLSDEEATSFARELLDQVTMARRLNARLRVLLDNRLGNVFPAAAVEALNAALKTQREPGDRIAILVRTISTRCRLAGT